MDYLCKSHVITEFLREANFGIRAGEENVATGAGKMAQLEKCLPQKNKNPIMYEKPGTAACACNPHNAEAGTGSQGVTKQKDLPNQGVPANKRPWPEDQGCPLPLHAKHTVGTYEQVQTHPQKKKQRKGRQNREGEENVTVEGGHEVMGHQTKGCQQRLEGKQTSSFGPVQKGHALLTP